MNEENNEQFLAALQKLLTYTKAGYGVGITFDAHSGVIADIGSDCQVLVNEGEGWLDMASKAISQVIVEKTKQDLEKFQIT